MKRIFCLTIVLCAASFVAAQAQQPARPQAPQGLTQSCPTPSGWKDAKTFTLFNGDYRNPTYFEENVETGARVQVEGTNPMARAPRPAGGAQGQSPYGLEADAKNPTLSPDNAWVAYTLNNDLYAKELATNKVVRYTFDGSETTLNGWASWVYYEEILGRGSRYRSFWWSPDSRHLAFFRCDDQKVPMFPIYVADGQHGYTERTRYPKAGDPNPEVKIGIVPVAGGAVTWADFNEKDDQYFGTPFWTPTGDALWVQWMNRDQDHLILYSVAPADGSKKKVYEEQVDTWLDWVGNPLFVDKGFLMVRDFEKWQQVYLCPWDGSAATRLTSGNNWGLRILAVDTKTQTLFYSARKEISTHNDIYSVSMVPSKKKTEPAPKRLTEGDYNFSGAQFSPDYKYFTVSYSNVSTPTVSALFSVKKGLVRILGDQKGPEYDRQMELGNVPVTEIHYITTADGFTIPATITYPLHMDKSKTYPVIVSIYGGPDAGTVMDSWTNPERVYSWAKEGVIQIAMDHRGSGHCGKLGMDMMHRDLGHWEINDYKLWIDYFASIAPINRNKVGITGFSYGGYISAYAVITAGDYFQYGLAGAGVHDWSLYDSHYGERFMDLPKDNPEGYKTSSVVQNAQKYGTYDKETVLYMTHGTSDDNVHYQNSMQLVKALMQTGHHFQFMIYPGERHGYGGFQGQFFSKENEAFWRRYLLDQK